MKKNKKILYLLFFFLLVSLKIFSLPILSLTTDTSADSQNQIFTFDNTIGNTIGNTIVSSISNWDDDALLKLISIIKTNKNIQSKFFLLSKLYFYLTFVKFEKNNHIFTKQLINENNDNPGYLNLALFYGEKAFRNNKNNMELLYYLTFSAWKLIRSPATFFKYRDTMLRYEHKMLRIDKTNLYSLLFEANFHLTFPVLGGAIRKKGERARKLLIKLYPNSTMAYNTLSYIYYKEKDFLKAIEFDRKCLELDSANLRAINSLSFLQGFYKNLTIDKISFVPQKAINSNIFFDFISLKKGDILTPTTLVKVEKELSRYRVIQDVSLDYKEQTDDKVDIILDLHTNVNRVININTGQELVFDKDDILTGMRVRDNLIPPVFYFQDPSLFNTGILNFKFYTVSFLKWNAFLNINPLETLDINIGFDSWILPILYSLKERSARNKYIAKINYLYIEPLIGIAKYFTNIHSNLSFDYRAKVYFLLPDSFDTTIENSANFTYPPTIFTEHKLRLDFTANFINLLEFGWVREGFKVEASVEWSKITPDITWGYSDFPTTPTNLCFTFFLLGEYSKFIKNIFYLSVAGQYKGGINLYKLTRIPIGKGTLGTPFGYEIKVHGFDRDKYFADHLFLLNTLFGFKTSKYFHLGLYYDIAAFFEREAKSYITQLPGSNSYFNIIMGFGSFFKWTFGYFIDIFFEASFGLDLGDMRINGPVLGFYLQKTFLLDYLKIKSKKFL